MDQAPSGRWPALIAAITASRFSSGRPMRRIAAAAPPVANALAGPFAERAVGLAHALDLRGPAGEVGETCSRRPRARRSTSGPPRTPWRWPRNRRSRRRSSPCRRSSAPPRPAARSPCVTTSGFPPGVWANPPPWTLHDFTNAMHAATSGTEPPTYSSTRRPVFVAPRRRGLSRAGGEPAVGVLVGRGVGGGLGEFGGSLGQRPASGFRQALRVRGPARTNGVS